MSATLCSASRELLADPLGRHLLARVPECDLESIASALAGSDVYGEGAHVRAAVSRVPAGIRVEDVIHHALWCARREAVWRVDSSCAQEIEVDIIGREWLEESLGHPTILVSPMTLCTHDAVHVVATLNARMRNRQGVLFYGEELNQLDLGLPPEAEVLTGDSGIGMLRQVMTLFAANGAFCTYADFVYQGHDAIKTSLFGVERPMSKGFVYLATRPGVMLLPCLQTRARRGICARFEEPVLFDVSQDAPEWTEQMAAQLIASMLEGLISMNPDQWLLLPTLTCESPEMAMA